MSAHRFFLTGPLSGDGEQRLALSESDAHHATDVLRLRVGEVIDVVEPGSRVMRVRVTQAGAEGVCASVVEELAVAPQPRVTLFQGVGKGEKMDDVVRQAVEVGAEEIVPILTARSVVRLDAAKRAARAERWRRVAQAAAKQAKRHAIPVVRDTVDLADATSLFSAYDGVVVLWEECEGIGVASAVRRLGAGDGARIALVVGPEGGLSAEEVAALETLGAVPATLGPTILRTETAAVVALALVISALGGLGNAGE